MQATLPQELPQHVKDMLTNFVTTTREACGAQLQSVVLFEIFLGQPESLRQLWTLSDADWLALKTIEAEEWRAATRSLLLKKESRRAKPRGMRLWGRGAFARGH